ncbi:hypothetical protein CAEBREN_25819 [Caenorhabditis brenneri]|uniref:Uncharacterized protein n=1 Tax=Caenorhabditis brenneri TaxID=135651 RepID=G0NKE9_CAEBE|nr:hypothetical protein CAEBREN_25819 [Caenorhabditis brenneri]
MMNKWSSQTQESSKTLVWIARFTKPYHLDCHASDQLKTAVDALFASRRTLMNSYIFTFFLEKGNNARIFENNQADLHGAVEKLSKTLHDEISIQRPEYLKKLLTKIHDKCVYVEHRQKILLNHCKEGYDYNFWKFEEQPF